MAINPGSNINNTFDSLYNNKSSGKEERKKRQFKFILHQLELRINIYIYIHAELLADTNFPLIRTGLGQNSWLQIDQSVRILMSDSAPTYVCARAHACRGARCARARALKFEVSKDESIHGEAALPQRRAPLDYDPMGPRAPFPTPSSPIRFFPIP